MNAISPATVTQQVTTTPLGNDQLFIRLAREIAMDIHDLPAILKRCNIKDNEWVLVQNHPRFKQLLTSALEEWGSAMNTQERIRVKSLAFIEECLPEFFALAHDKNETLNSKVEVLKTVSKFAGVGQSTDAPVGEKFSVTINLGGGESVKIEKQMGPVIDAEVIEINRDLA